MEKALKTATTMELAGHGVSKLKEESTAVIDYIGLGKRNFRKGPGTESSSSQPNTSSSSHKASAQKSSSSNRRKDFTKNQTRVEMSVALKSIIILFVIDAVATI